MAGNPVSMLFRAEVMKVLRIDAQFKSHHPIAIKLISLLLSYLVTHLVAWYFILTISSYELSIKFEKLAKSFYPKNWSEYHLIIIAITAFFVSVQYLSKHSFSHNYLPKLRRYVHAVPFLVVFTILGYCILSHAIHGMIVIKAPFFALAFKACLLPTLPILWVNNRSNLYYMSSVILVWGIAIAFYYYLVWYMQQVPSNFSVCSDSMDIDGPTNCGPGFMPFTLILIASFLLSFCIALITALISLLHNKRKSHAQTH